MKLSSLAVAVLSVPLVAAAAHADITYYENSHSAPQTLTTAKAYGLSESDVETYCQKIEDSVAFLKEADQKAKDGDYMLKQYVIENYRGLYSTFGDTKALEMESLPDLSSSPLDNIATQTLAVEQHNNIAQKGQDRIEQARGNLLKAVGATTFCEITSCDDGDY